MSEVLLADAVGLNVDMEESRGLIVVAEDEVAIAELERVYLARAGFGVHVEHDGARALAAIQRLRPALVLLDVGMPSMDGIEVCRRMRSADDWTPIIFATAHGDEVDRIVGLELGADDYVTKPFSPRELVARVKGILRRSAAVPHSDAHAVRVGLVELDPLRRSVLVRGRAVELTTREFDLLAALMAEPGRVFSRAQLLSNVWGFREYVPGRTIDVHIAQVRAKLGDASPIRTVRGIGYAAEA